MGARPRLKTELDTRPGRHAVVSTTSRCSRWIRTLPAASIDTFTTLLESAKGHVLASGELVGLGSADAK